MSVRSRSVRVPHRAARTHRPWTGPAGRGTPSRPRATGRTQNSWH